MRSYNQYCALAKALDVVGDRWALLIVRELLIRGPCRYTDLREGLPGVATNLLATRLSELEAAGLVVRAYEPPPVATHLFHLTERGRALEAAMLALGSWGAPLLGQASPDDVLRGHWLVMPLKLHLRDGEPTASPLLMELRVGDEKISIAASSGTVAVTLGPCPNASVVLEGNARALLRLLTGQVPLERAQGIKVQGNIRSISRIIPLNRKQA